MVGGQKMNLETPKLFHRSFIRTSKAHRHVCHHSFQTLGLTAGQPKILDYLARSKGCSQKELSQHCHIEPATTTSLLSTLERQQLIFREPNRQDRRILNVYLTEEGKRRQKMAKELMEQIDEQCFEGFSEEERRQTIEYLNRIYENLKGKENLNHD